MGPESGSGSGSVPEGPEAAARYVVDYAHAHILEKLGGMDVMDESAALLREPAWYLNHLGPISYAIRQPRLTDTQLQTLLEDFDSLMLSRSPSLLDCCARDRYCAFAASYMANSEHMDALRYIALNRLRETGRFLRAGDALFTTFGFRLRVVKHCREFGAPAEALTFEAAERLLGEGGLVCGREYGSGGSDSAGGEVPHHHHHHPFDMGDVFEMEISSVFCAGMDGTGGTHVHSRAAIARYLPRVFRGCEGLDDSHLFQRVFEAVSRAKTISDLLGPEEPILRSEPWYSPRPRRALDANVALMKPSSCDQEEGGVHAALRWHTEAMAASWWTDRAHEKFQVRAAWAAIRDLSGAYARALYLSASASAPASASTAPLVFAFISTPDAMDLNLSLHPLRNQSVRGGEDEGGASARCADDTFGLILACRRIAERCAREYGVLPSSATDPVDLPVIAMLSDPVSVPVYNLFARPPASLGDADRARCALYRAPGWLGRGGLKLLVTYARLVRDSLSHRTRMRTRRHRAPTYATVNLASAHSQYDPTWAIETVDSILAVRTIEGFGAKIGHPLLAEVAMREVLGVSLFGEAPGDVMEAYKSWEALAGEEKASFGLEVPLKYLAHLVEYTFLEGGLCLAHMR